MFDTTRQPVSLKLNVRDDKAIKTAKRKKNTPIQISANFFLKVSSMFLL